MLAKHISDSFLKFKINLKGKKVLTEAASGNYICTPVLSALSGADVFAVAKESKFGTIQQVQKEVLSMAKELKIKNQISIIKNFSDIDLAGIDVVTNTGFVRPINKALIDKLSPSCVIPLMWEPWEFRPKELDLDYAINKGLKVYGTNEADPRLLTMNYIGLIVLDFIKKGRGIENNLKILIIGSEKFNTAIQYVLEKENVSVTSIFTNKFRAIDVSDYDIIVVSEIASPKLIIGSSADALINSSSLTEDQLIIHIAGNVEFTKIRCKHYPENPASIGHMSYTTDYIDPVAVFDLHAAGLKVAEGMLEAKRRGLEKIEFKKFMETDYPALAFEDKKYW
jgi:hypothetical protein